MAQEKRLIVLTGPTCSGKTMCTMQLARRFPVEVISADSMQVYRFMDIATAKPTPEERSAVPHHLIDVVNPDEQFNAAMFVSLARQTIAEVISRGAIPIVAGGTGLYIKALVYGLAPAPGADRDIRAALAALARRRGSAYLAWMLERLDMDSARRVGANDLVRIVRFLEIIFRTGRKASEILGVHGFGQPVLPARIVCIMPDRQVLYDRINTRTLQMFDAGLVDETKRLLAMGYNPFAASMRTLAYRHVVDYLDQEADLGTCISLVQRDTRRFARRQLTWFRAQADHVFLGDMQAACDTVSRWIEEDVSGCMRLV